MASKKKSKEQGIDKRIVERMVRDKKMKAEDLKAYLKKLPDVSSLAEEMDIEKELTKKKR